MRAKNVFPRKWLKISRYRSPGPRQAPGWKSHRVFKWRGLREI